MHSVSNSIDGEFLSVKGVYLKFMTNFSMVNGSENEYAGHIPPESAKVLQQGPGIFCIHCIGCYFQVQVDHW